MKIEGREEEVDRYFYTVGNLAWRANTMGSGMLGL